MNESSAALVGKRLRQNEECGLATAGNNGLYLLFDVLLLIMLYLCSIKRK